MKQGKKKFATRPEREIIGSSQFSLSEDLDRSNGRQWLML
jgi:hypothetical protein